MKHFDLIDSTLERNEDFRRNSEYFQIFLLKRKKKNDDKIFVSRINASDYTVQARIFAGIIFSPQTTPSQSCSNRGKRVCEKNTRHSFAYRTTVLALWPPFMCNIKILIAREPPERHK